MGIKDSKINRHDQLPNISQIGNPCVGNSIKQRQLLRIYHRTAPPLNYERYDARGNNKNKQRYFFLSIPSEQSEIIVTTSGNIFLFFQELILIISHQRPEIQQQEDKGKCNEHRFCHQS